MKEGRLCFRCEKVSNVSEKHESSAFSRKERVWYKNGSVCFI